MKVIGIGDNVIDKYVRSGTMYPGGNALNFSVYARMLGMESAYMGVLGNDRPGMHIHGVLKTLGVDTSRCRIEQGENGISEIDISDGERRITEVNDCGVLRQYPITLGESELAYLRGFSLAHTSIYSGLESQLGLIKGLGLAVSFDFSDLWDDRYIAAVCPFVDYALFSCAGMTDAQLDRLIRAALGYGCSLFIGTLGKRGAIVADRQRRYVKAPYSNGAPLDTLGAGDAFAAGFLVSYISGISSLERMKGRFNGELAAADSSDFLSALIQQSLCSGNALAAYVCGINGAFGYGIPIYP